MFVTHLQIEVGASILASGVKKIIAFSEAWEWPTFSDGDRDARKAECDRITDAARKAGLFGYGARIVNCGEVTDFVETASIEHDGHGLIVNTSQQTPSLFCVVDDLVRVPHLNYDFHDYARFEFKENMLFLQDLTEVDKTLLRLANYARNETRDDGSTVERVSR